MANLRSHEIDRMWLDRTIEFASRTIDVAADSQSSDFDKSCSYTTKVSNLHTPTVFNTWPPRSEWELIQNQCCWIDGEVGIALRQQAYRPFFQRLGKNVRISAGCHFSSPWRIVLDDDVRINAEAIFEASSAIYIGRHARIGHRFFVHSANHDISPESPKAFFERGHSFKPVFVGDNVLISANVSVLPGAQIGDGSFLAANTLVPGRSYPQNTYLAGTPAAQMPNGSRKEDAGRKLLPAPSVALIVRSLDSVAADAAKILVEALGLPQVKVVAADAPLPDNVKAVVEWEADLDGPEWDVPSWRQVLAPQAETRLDGGAARRLGLPHEIRYQIVENGFELLPALDTTTRATWFVTKNAYLKAPRPIPLEARAMWGLLFLASEHGCSAGDPRWNAVLEEIKPLVEEGEKCSSRKSIAQLLEELVAAFVADSSDEELPLAEFISSPTVAMLPKLRKFLLTHPWLLPYIALSNVGAEENEFCNVIDELAVHFNNSVRKSCLALAYTFTGRTQDAHRITNELFDPSWCLPDNCLIRVLPGHTAFDRQPPLLSLLLDLFFNEFDGSLDSPNICSELAWQPVGNSDLQPFVAQNDRAFSHSLVENWLKLHQLPRLSTGQFLLDKGVYERSLASLEAAWLSLFEKIFDTEGITAVRLHPWPSGYRAALSLRFDVDRDTSAGQVHEIMRIQTEKLNAPCGSWYFIPDAEHNNHVKNVLKTWNQEFGSHLCRATDQQAKGEGVTAHSAPNSQYWRGAKSIRAYEDSGAVYAEAMICLPATPRRFLLEERATHIWLTPPHFPLEGSQQERTTDYFNQRFSEFRYQIENGGHAIIGTHPDCNMQILEDVIRTIDVDDLWCVPVATALDRCRNILGYGRVEALVCEDNMDDVILLRSERTLSDVVYALRPSQANAEWQTGTTQIQATIARALSLGEVKHPAESD